MDCPRVERSLDWIRLAARFPRAHQGRGSRRVLPHRRLGGRDRAWLAQEREPVTAAAFVDFLRRELAPTPGRGSATFRLTLACLIATIPILTHRIPHALLVMIVMYLITQEDTAATLLGSILGVVGVTHRPGRGAAGLDGRPRHRLAPHRVLRRLPLHRIVSQARAGDRRARLCDRPAGGPRDDPARRRALAAREPRRVRALALVVRDARARRQPRASSCCCPRATR